MSSVYQVHALATEQLMALKKEKAARAQMTEENVVCGDEQRAPKRKTASEPKIDDRALKRRKASSESPVSMAEEKAPIMKRWKSASPVRDSARFSRHGGSPDAVSILISFDIQG